MIDAQSKIDPGEAISEFHSQLGDQELASTANSYAKQRRKLDLDSAILDARIASAGDEIESRPSIVIGSDGLAKVVEPGLFSQGENA